MGRDDDLTIECCLSSRLRPCKTSSIWTFLFLTGVTTIENTASTISPILNDDGLVLMNLWIEFCYDGWRNWKSWKNGRTCQVFACPSPYTQLCYPLCESPPLEVPDLSGSGQGQQSLLMLWSLGHGSLGFRRNSGWKCWVRGNWRIVLESSGVSSHQESPWRICWIAWIWSEWIEQRRGCPGQWVRLLAEETWLREVVASYCILIRDGLSCENHSIPVFIHWGKLSGADDTLNTENNFFNLLGIRAHGQSQSPARGQFHLGDSECINGFLQYH